MVEILYYFFVGIVAAACLVIVFTPHLLYAALGLVGVVVGTAAIYFLQGAAFIATIQLMLCGGGVVVLLLYTIMLAGLPPISQNKRPAKLVYSFLTVACLAFLLLFPIIFFTDPLPRAVPQTATTPPNTVANLGLQLLGPYAIAFELAGVILLIILLGALYIAKDL